MTAIIHLIFRHPHVHEKLMKALEEAVGDEEFPRHDEVKDIPYLQATIDEGHVDCFSFQMSDY
jgi:benzoate 4-monooxygenase